ncbi:uncharacterized protein TRIADDRAFT_59457 [Trichoplax adhaerens]|uniref:Transcription factor TFIIIB component B'' Myb domain-containing protein n=1 Tax=Trichoplax adhaerens TaxID=10228 RepID=B3S5S4_TRIAD|nr:hypothetical protein TRIADDRAFT_59457 [Trichoplax adhaerens]EDV21951.1 hypothetical protein TRIADDRAFT_59457 [Trichoplax adhaerens]|eukprot:XP_002115588.1 hypothetical protein TRIADDRAFT_59457 [Trichoplax adhaerens]
MPREKFTPNIASRHIRRCNTTHGSNNTSTSSSNDHNLSPTTASPEGNTSQSTNGHASDDFNPHQIDHLDGATEKDQPSESGVSSTLAVNDAIRSRKGTTPSKTTTQDVNGRLRSKIKNAKPTQNTSGQSINTQASPGLTRRFRHLSQPILSDNVQTTRNDHSNQSNPSYTTAGRKRAVPSVVTANEVTPTMDENNETHLSQLNDADTNLNKNKDDNLIINNNPNGSYFNANYHENTNERDHQNVNLPTGRLTRNRFNKVDSNSSKEKRGQSYHNSNDSVGNKRRRLKKKTVSQSLDCSQMTMSDLIYYNPSTNPMKHKYQEAAVDPTDDHDINAIESNDTNENEDFQEKPDRLPDRENRAPQVSIGPNGKIILNEDSLVVEAASETYELAAVIDESDALPTYRSYKKKSTTDRWNVGETNKFYRALSQVGTDFSLMRRLVFPKRDRNELKNKFKREDRFNRELVNQALRKRLPLDTSVLTNSPENEKNDAQR